MLLSPVLRPTKVQEIQAGGVVAQVAVSEEELEESIRQLLQCHRYILEFEVVKMTGELMKLVREFVTSQNMQKPF